MRKLADAGQAVLCTIHQPSAILFQEFDRLLFLARGGRTVYFGEIGKNSRKLLDYFESNGARKCSDDENPAEYMLEIVNAGKNNEGKDWHDVWKGSDMRQGVERDIDRIHEDKKHEEVAGSDDPTATSEFAMPFRQQLIEVTYRVFQQYWRMPSYVFAKFGLGIAAGLFIGFSFFKADSSQAGMQIVLFSAFMLTTIFTTLVQQVSCAVSELQHNTHNHRSNRCLSRSESYTKFVSDRAKHIPGRLSWSPISLSRFPSKL